MEEQKDLGSYSEGGTADAVSQGSTGLHTEGPWLFEFCEKSGTVYVLGKHGDAGRTRQSDGLGYIFPLSVSLEGDENRYPEICPEQMANARLIAAAPDLLEALTDLRKYVKRAPYGVLKASDVAIAKALGQ